MKFSNLLEVTQRILAQAGFRPGQSMLPFPILKR